MKKLFLCLTVLAVAGASVNGQSEQPFPAGKVGVISFTSAPPWSQWMIYVTPVKVTKITHIASGYAATSSANPDDFVDGKACLNQAAFAGMNFPPFDPNGTYTVVVVSAEMAGQFKVQTGVTFVNGSAVIDIDTMTTGGRKSRR
ncbi:MAG: hypothetical protein LBB82_01730 [Treponema sp.]|jgi:hypothetical protein|nr:hypothetical protein [Treponema sp.]